MDQEFFMTKLFLIIGFFSFFSCIALCDELYCNFLSAAKNADSFLAVELSGAKKIITCYSLPHNSKISADIQNINLFMRSKAGIYLFPAKNGRVLNFMHPYFSVKNPEITYSLLLRFQNMKIKDEAQFLIGNFLKQTDANIRITALKRMAENQFFNDPFEPNTARFFQNFYTDNSLSVPEKRLLLEYFAIRNFNPMTEVFILALSDSCTAKLSGKIFYAQNRDLFSSIIKKYVSNKKLWRTAIKQSDFFIEDKEFIDESMKWFDYKNPQNNPADFIPLFFSRTAKPKHNELIIKELLSDSKNTAAYELYRRLAFWLDQSNSKQFKNEIMQFLVQNRNNHGVTDGIIYPTMLSVLRKSGHPQATKMLLEYLIILKKRNNKPLAEKVCILFRKENQANPTLDELIQGLK